jgi:hypothetical protein
MSQASEPKNQNGCMAPLSLARKVVKSPRQGSQRIGVVRYGGQFDDSVGQCWGLLGR